LTNYTPEEIEDLLQDIFIKVYKNLNSFDQDLKFSSWIYRIAHNEVISSFRLKKRRPWHYPGEENNIELTNLVSEVNIEKEINDKLTRENIEKLLDRLDEKYSEVLILKYFEEKDYQEISDILKKPLGTVATLLNRAKKEFKKEVEKNNIQI
jgi:RNA polymerase sigma-70 factor (ECF subfamily)